MSKKLELTGQQFTDLHVLSECTQNNDRRSIWLCKCFCGRKIKIPGYQLKCGHTKRCRQCGWKFSGSKRKGGELSKGTWMGIVRGAKDRNLSLEITREQAFEKFIFQNRKCALTGLEIKLNRKTGESKSKVTASLDRIDSDKPYTIDNVQWLHKCVNMLKRDMPESEFVNWCCLISDHKRKNNV